jgi:hypothetical protein
LVSQLREDLLLSLSYLPLGVPNGCNLYAIKQFFWRRCRGERRFLQGESLMLNHLLCFCFALFYVCLHHFIKNTKKLVPSVVVIFVALLLSCFIMLSINGWFL